jgi:hypothetical protein
MQLQKAAARNTHTQLKLVIGPWRDVADLPTVRLETCFARRRRGQRGHAGEAALEKAQLLTFDFPLNAMLNGGHWSPEELCGWAADAKCPDLAARLEARLSGGAPAQRAALEAEEWAAWSDWSLGDESDPEAEAVRWGKVRAGKLGGKMGSREDKSRGGKMQPREDKSRDAKMQPREAKVLGGKRAKAAKWAKAAAAARGLRKDLAPWRHGHLRHGSPFGL